LTADDFFFAGEPQRRVIADVTHYVQLGVRRIHLIAERRSGATRLLKYLSQMAGLGSAAADIVLMGQGDTNRGWHRKSSSEVKQIVLIDRETRLFRPRFEDVDTIIMVCKGGSEFRVSKDGPTAHIKLSAWSLEQSKQFICHGLRHAGGTTAIFHDETIQKLHRSGAGLVGEIAMAAEAALMVAAANGRRQVRPEDVNWPGVSRRAA